MEDLNLRSQRTTEERQIERERKREANADRVGRRRRKREREREPVLHYSRASANGGWLAGWLARSRSFVRLLARSHAHAHESLLRSLRGSLWLREELAYTERERRKPRCWGLGLFASLSTSLCAFIASDSSSYLSEKSGTRELRRRHVNGTIPR